MVTKSKSARLIESISAKSGFTLIELLVVMAIIGFLASVVLVNLNGARMKARDARRLSDMKQIRLALELYYAKIGAYPNYTSNDDCAGWDIGYYDSNDTFINALVEKSFFSKTPGDPTATDCNGYKYYRYTATDATDYVCSVIAPFYVLGVANMETSDGTHPSSPGWSCGNRNWGNPNELEWVTGGFEN